MRDVSDLENESADSLLESQKWSARRRALSVAKKPPYHTYLITEDYQVTKKENENAKSSLLLIRNEPSASPIKFGSIPLNSNQMTTAVPFGRRSSRHLLPKPNDAKGKKRG